MGFSFDYPSNWHLDAPKTYDETKRRVALTIRNYDEVVAKGDKTTEQLKIEIGALPLPDSIPTLDAWATQYREPIVKGLESNAFQSPVENIEIDSVPAVRWTVTAELIPQGSVVVGIVKNERLYVIRSYPATSKYIATLNELISRFRLP